MRTHKLLQLLLRAGVIGLAGLLAVGCSSSADKPPEPTELESIPNSGLKPDTVWKANVGEIEKEPAGFRTVVEQGVVYTADESGEVAAHRADNGKRLWRVELDKPLSAGPGLAGDLVLVGTHDGEVLALSRQDGGARWASQLSGEVLAAPRGDSSVVVVRCFDGRVYGLSADSGQRLWVQQTAVPTLSLRGVGGPVIVSGQVLVGLDNGKVLAVDATTGQPLWESVVSVPTGRTELERLVDVDAEPLEIDGTVYAVSYAGDMVALDLSRGQTFWRAQVASITGITGFLNWLFVSSRDGAVVAIDRETGDILWEQKALLYRELSRPVMHNGLVAVADLDGYVHWLSPQNGQILGRGRPVRERVSTPPVVVDDRLYIRADDGKLAAVVAKTR